MKTPEQLKGTIRSMAAKRNLRAQEVLQMFLFERILERLANSKYKKNHDSVIEFVKTQIGIDLNNYRDGDGSSPYTTTYWDKNGIKLCINWCGSSGGMDRNTQYRIADLVNKSNGKLSLEWGGAWFKYIYFTDDIKEV